MISRVRGTLLSRDLERVEILTGSGVVYEVEVPLSVLERLPREGEEVELRTAYVVREDSAALYGFLEAHERELFDRLLTASGVGPRLAIAMLSAFSARRLARALAEGDVAALKQVSGVGKKTAERLVLELGDRVADLMAAGAVVEPVVPGVADAVSALVALGFTAGEADRAVRRALEEDGPPESVETLIRQALAHLRT
ncbi:MAG: Holliday junction branch migration protein RuvA [Gemmatimonadetes bacterium]|nr:Holliday junction branch migration protein RuvA [Gemmatimonadota bacterium]